jgi:hypothetical protein
LLPVAPDVDLDDISRLARITETLRAKPGALMTALVVDDAHSLDQASIDMLFQLAAGQVATVVATVLDAVGEPLSLPTAERAVGAERLEQLEAQRLVVCTETSTGTIVHVAHPILGQVVRDALPRLRLRRLQLDLARALELAPLDPVDAVRSVRWRLKAGVVSDPRFLLKAASVARTFDRATAEALARAAAEREPSIEAVTLLASILTSSGRPEEAAELLAVWPSSDLRPADQELVLFMQSVGTGLLGGDPKAGIALLEQSGGSARLRGMQSTLMLLDSNVDEARALAASVLADADADTAARTVAGIGVVGSLFYIGATTELRRRYDEAVGDADAERAHNPDGLGQIQVSAFCALAESGAIDEAESLARRRFDASVTGGGEEAGWDRSRWAYVLGRIALIRGDLGGAVRMLRLAAATPAPFDRPFPRYTVSFLARALAGVGQPEQARTVLQAVPSDLPRFRLFEPELELAEAAILAADGYLAEAAERAAWAAELAGVSRMCATILLAAHDAARYGGAALVRNTVTDALPHVDGELLVWRARCVLAMAAGDASGLDEVGGAFEQMGANLFGAEAAAHAARLHRIAGHAFAAIRSEARHHRLAACCPGAIVPWLSGTTALTPLTQRRAASGRPGRRRTARRRDRRGAVTVDPNGADPPQPDLREARHPRALRLPAALLPTPLRSPTTDDKDASKSDDRPHGSPPAPCPPPRPTRG